MDLNVAAAFLLEAFNLQGSISLSPFSKSTKFVGMFKINTADSIDTNSIVGTEALKSLVA